MPLAMQHVHAPAGPWRELLTAAAAGALLLLIGAESGWRALDHEPSMRDDPAAWSVRRAQVYGAAPRDRLVFLGSSRIQLAIDTGLLRQAFPGLGVEQLAVEGRSPVAAFLDLAADARFDGVVVLELQPDDLEPTRAGQQQGYVDFFRAGQPLERRIERRIEMELQGRLVFASPELRLPRVLESLLRHGALPLPYQVTTYPDRSRADRFEFADAAGQRRKRMARDAEDYAKDPPSSAADWQARALRLAQAGERIAARGGAVLVFRMPVDDDRAAFEERWYPRAQYWSGFAAASRVKVIDGRDVVELAGVPTPDGSHIDARDRQEFTLRLARLLLREGLLPAPGGA
jgi:hypothetical protein